MAYHNKGGYVDRNVPMLGAFGEAAVSTYKPIAAWTFAYNINPEIIKVTTRNTGTVVHDRSFAKMSTGTDAFGFAQIETRAALRYQPGMGGLVRFTAVFSEPKEDSVQLIGLGSSTDGMFFGYNGLNFGTARLIDGVDNWTYEKDIPGEDRWNIDRPVKQDWQKLNVYQIQYQWLGGGELRFFIEDNRSGAFSLVNFVRFAGRHTDVSLRNPTLPLTAFVHNIGNTTDLTLHTPSGTAGQEGEIHNHSLVTTHTIDNSVAGVTTEVPIITLKNQETYFLQDNRIRLHQLVIFMTCEGTKATKFRTYKNATLVGAVYTDVDIDATPAQQDIAATSFTATSTPLTFPLAGSGSDRVDLSHLTVLMSPGETLTITAESANATDVDVSILFETHL